MAEPAEERGPLVWRLPPYQPALLILITTAMAAWNIYGHPSSITRLFTIAIGVVALVVGIAALRMFLVVDDDGIAVRRIVHLQWVEWPDVAEIEVVTHATGGPTIRVSRTDGTYVEVPPSLLQPGTPTSKPRALAKLKDVARQVERRRPNRR